MKKYIKIITKHVYIIVLGIFIGLFISKTSSQLIDIGSLSLVKLDSISTYSTSNNFISNINESVSTKGKSNQKDSENKETTITEYENSIVKIYRTQIWSYTFLVTLSLVSMLVIILIIFLMIPKILKTTKSYLKEDKSS